MAAISQVGCRPCFIFNFTWIGLSEAIAKKTTKDVMRFRGTLHHIIQRVLMANPSLGPVYLGKVDLADAYMWICVRLEDTHLDGFPPP